VREVVRAVRSKTAGGKSIDVAGEQLTPVELIAIGVEDCEAICGQLNEQANVEIPEAQESVSQLYAFAVSSLPKTQPAMTRPLSSPKTTLLKPDEKAG
jgi:hypothetical protein